MLHAAALDDRVSEVTVKQSIVSWMDVVGAPLGRELMTHVVPRALTRYDLPDLIRAAKPRTVRIVDPLDGMGKPRETPKR